mmetsp:Transcript_2993/g.4050  ORF Transcript_2993/g.4050 Transcript_2993/m.4050 type:complete len:225 (-) Transcript_2993:536-1210(-)
MIITCNTRFHACPCLLGLFLFGDARGWWCSLDQIVPVHIEALSPEVWVANLACLPHSFVLHRDDGSRLWWVLVNLVRALDNAVQTIRLFTQETSAVLVQALESYFRFLVWLEFEEFRASSRNVEGSRLSEDNTFTSSVKNRLQVLLHVWSSGALDVLSNLNVLWKGKLLDGFKSSFQRLLHLRSIKDNVRKIHPWVFLLCTSNADEGFKLVSSNPQFTIQKRFG